MSAYKRNHIQILVSEMTYTVSSGTLNSSIPYHTIFKFGEMSCFIVHEVCVCSYANPTTCVCDNVVWAYNFVCKNRRAIDQLYSLYLGQSYYYTPAPIGWGIMD